MSNEIKTLGEVFLRQSFLLSVQRFLLGLQVVFGPGTDPGLQDGPRAVVRRILIREVRWPFRRHDEVRKIGLAPCLRAFRPVSRD